MFMYFEVVKYNVYNAYLNVLLVIFVHESSYLYLNSQDFNIFVNVLYDCERYDTEHGTTSL